MNREIKFRGKRVNGGEWVYGMTISNGTIKRKANDVFFEVAENKWVGVHPETLGQYTGLKDRNRKEIYEGDIVEYYELGTYCINPDCDIHLHGYGSYIRRYESVVKFEDGVFGVCDNDEDGLRPLTNCGIYEEMLNDMKEDAYLETNDYNIDNTIAGVKVIGNIHDNTE